MQTEIKLNKIYLKAGDIYKIYETKNKTRKSG